MDETGTHKYHDIIQSRQSEHTKIKKKLTTELATILQKLATILQKLATILQKPFKTNLNSKSLTIWWLPKCTAKVILQYLRKIQWYISVSVVQNYN